MYPSVKTAYLVTVIKYADPALFGPSEPLVETTSPYCAKIHPTTRSPSGLRSCMFYHKKSLAPSSEHWRRKINSTNLPSIGLLG